MNINAEAVDNNEENEVDKDDMNHTIEEQPVDNINENNSVIDTGAGEPDDATIDNNSNTLESTEEVYMNTEVNATDKDKETNHTNVPK